jgi:hypothetical protein
MSAKYIPIREVVANVLDECDKSIGDQDKVWILAYRGLEDMHFSISAEPLTVMLPVQGNLTCILPPNYVGWSKIGIPTNNGNVATLKVNNSMNKFRDNNPNRLTDIAGEIGSQWLTPSGFYLNFWTGQTYIPLFGLAGGIATPGECLVDEANNIIVLPPNFPYPNVLLEYITCPEKDQDYKVDRRYRESLIAFCKWKLKLGTAQDYYNELVKARRNAEPIHIQEVNQALRENQKYVLKA